MRILIDTDVLLDVALDRKPHVTDSAAVLRWAAATGDACVAWHTLTNLSYLLKGGARTFLENLLEIVSVAPVDETDALRALSLPMKDIEDAFQAASALAWKADWIVTRNVSDYAKSPVRAISPGAFLRMAE